MSLLSTRRVMWILPSWWLWPWVRSIWTAKRITSSVPRLFVFLHVNFFSNVQCNSQDKTLGLFWIKAILQSSVGIPFYVIDSFNICSMRWHTFKAFSESITVPHDGILLLLFLFTLSVLSSRRFSKLLHQLVQLLL